MPHEDRRVRIIVLAAQRRGVIDPLAAEHAVSHKCLVPLRGRALISYVLATAARHPATEEVVVSVENELFDSIAVLAADLGEPGLRVRCMAAEATLTDSVFAAAAGHAGPIVITTADNVLLSEHSISAMMSALGGGIEVGIAMAKREDVLTAHPDGQRRFYAFKDDAYSNCNLYGLASSGALSAAELFRGGGQFARKASRIVKTFGLTALILMRLRLVTLEAGLRRLSRRLGLRIAPVILADGSQAIDVDNLRTYRVAAELLDRGDHG